ncbi:hypothetical protein F5144DRAFT_605629 [Chaetomium tenue]|uniref:Uncharacterized protein n=1 Tax=Chaetomium tenue TaxID=1854479 RepID=A0ACB7NZS6_9PEZI|nr:hypothetical protein F5144DRAFT_605629 [Chaetomium globosum]
MSNAIWSTDFENLRQLTFYDRWKSLKTSILPCTLFTLGSTQRWKMFPNLESIHFDIGATRYREVWRKTSLANRPTTRRKADREERRLVAVVPNEQILEEDLAGNEMTGAGAGTDSHTAGSYR